MLQYYTAQPKDSAFSANFDSYSAVWEGASLCTPPPEHHQMDRAVRWAICSASETDVPCLAAFAFPCYPNGQSAYHKITL